MGGVVSGEGVLGVGGEGGGRVVLTSSWLVGSPILIYLSLFCDMLAWHVCISAC